MKHLNPGLFPSQAVAKQQQQQQDRELWVMFSVVATVLNVVPGIPRLEIKTHSHWIAMYFHLYIFTTVLNTTPEQTFSETTEEVFEEEKAESKACWDDSHMAIPD